MIKKSQVTVYLIIGIVLIISVLATIGVTYKFFNDQSKKQIEEFNEVKEIKSLKSYVESCIKIVSDEEIISIAKNGGTYDTSKNDYIQYYKNKTTKNYRKLCDQAGYVGCVNQILTFDDVEYELSLIIQNKIESCVNLELFRSNGFNVTNKSLKVNVELALNDVIINVLWPIKIIKPQEVQEVENFNERIDKPLGKLIEIANQIINTELTGSFHNDKLMIDYFNKNGEQLIILKNKPYPDTVFSLILNNLEFNFGIAGEDTVSQVGYTQFNKYEKQLGCCNIVSDSKNQCYYNAQIDHCRSIGGLYTNKPCKCERYEFNDDDVFESPNCNGECNDCEKTWNPDLLDYSGPPRKHGESWCIYDSITNRGMDYVGSRHSRHMCINGEEFVEECRDFREEICTEYDYKDMTHSVCRINRWFDCTQCDTKDCCQDEEVRDCFWSGDDFPQINQKCHPLVPPGFRHWQGNGQDVCAQGTGEKTIIYLNIQKPGSMKMHFFVQNLVTVGIIEILWMRNQLMDFLRLITDITLKRFSCITVMD